ncbi:hypothetical protein CH373_12675 [Leptospira perolatii]|uniref:FAD/NAD(P)-binding domain-containing protein n=1 Tax=Leptospira perolatii TaxID=2023191 RepID=A0A2M9ZLT7_9LEPT|nr:FAD/NAD(P)-binding oxidoreductase [Leptospira perolatii]PJZ70212.1 hypothetical protein CH360_06295 [Leptospira perolatii]PJZ72903.1 hypothetical protein CH373_12675 [Leptospira perolatii]
MARIVIVGAGIAGLSAADELRKNISKKHEIIILEKEKEYTFQPSIPWILNTSRNPIRIKKAYKRSRLKGVVFENKEVMSIDFLAKTIRTDRGEITYDYLVLTPGAKYAPERLSGFKECASNLYDPIQAEEISKKALDWGGKKITILVGALPYKCPAAPYESAMILQDYIFEKTGRKPRIEIITPENLPMPVAGEEIGSSVVSLLDSKGIKFFGNSKALSIDPWSRQIVFENSKKKEFDVLLGIPPHVLPEFLQGSPIQGANGWIEVDAKTLHTKLKNVYAGGDVVGIQISNGRLLPKAGVFAREQGRIIAKNIMHSFSGEWITDEFRGFGACFLETGGGKAGFASGKFVGPNVIVEMKKPSIFWHWAKMIFEKWWLYKYFKAGHSGA